MLFSGCDSTKRLFFMRPLSFSGQFRPLAYKPDIPKTMAGLNLSWSAESLEPTLGELYSDSKKFPKDTLLEYHRRNEEQKFLLFKHRDTLHLLDNRYDYQGWLKIEVVRTKHLTQKELVVSMAMPAGMTRQSAETWVQCLGVKDLQTGYPKAGKVLN
jgi:hypothetical protein